MPDNPLLTLKLEEIRSIKFGDRSLSYKTGRSSFQVMFASHEEMDRAVREWFEQARGRGEFFRLDILKGLIRRR
jgi:hypothetical protein